MNIKDKCTKIIATISDKNCNIHFLRSLYEAGMDIVRINTAHQNLDGARMLIQNVRSVSEHIAIIVDTKGPEIRTQKIENPIQVSQGDLVSILHSSLPPQDNAFYLNADDVIDKAKVGCSLFIDDGEVHLTVVEVKNKQVVCLVESGQLIENRKSLNAPSLAFSLPSLSEKDKEFIVFSIKEGVDFIAHSFVRSADDVLKVQKILDQHNSDIQIISKIENQEGINNLDEILDHSYGIMIARGDLGIEIAPERIPGVQKNIIHACRQRAKSVIVATQMLHSMIKESRPTRAEVSDVANAVYDGTDAIMLSGETAYGKYPLEAVRYMSKIALETEHIMRDNFIKEKSLSNHVFFGNQKNNKQSRDYLCYVACYSVSTLPIKAIIIDTRTGRSARIISTYRVPVPIYAFATDKRILRTMSLCYGIFSYYSNKIEEAFVIESLSLALEKELIREEDMVVIVYGTPKREDSSEIIEINTVRKSLLGRV